MKPQNYLKFASLKKQTGDENYFVGPCPVDSFGTIPAVFERVSEGPRTISVLYKPFYPDISLVSDENDLRKAYLLAEEKAESYLLTLNKKKNGNGES